MKKIYYSLMALFVSATIGKAQVCDTTGNVVIFSNYDGGTLNIVVDQNIPNLKIGIVSYESSRVILTGAYVGNVTEVRWAGYNGGNLHCGTSSVANTTIAGVANNLDTIILYPAAGYSNANGYGSIICNYSCSTTTNQGGCNTPDQVVYYFVNAFGGTFRFHHTQYNCWLSNVNYNISAGGNCCAVPTTLGTNSIYSTDKKLGVYPNPAHNEMNLRFYSFSETHHVEIYNMLGAKVAEQNFTAETEKAKINIQNLAAGVYVVKLTEGEKTVTEKINIQ